jgi:hypothetical protein
MHCLFLSVARLLLIIQRPTDVGLVDVFHPVGKKNIGNNKEIELRNELPFLRRVVVLEPADLVPLATLAWFRHCEEWYRRSSLPVCVACTPVILCMSIFVYLAPEHGTSNVNYVACAQAMQARGPSPTDSMRRSGRVSSTSAWVLRGAIPSASGVKA